MAQEIFPAQKDDFEPFVTELTTTAVLGGESLAGRQLINKLAEAKGTTGQSSTESKTIIHADVEVRRDNIISSPEDLKSSTIEQRGGYNSLVTIPDHASGIVANLDFFSNIANFETAADALEKAMKNTESTAAVGEVLPMEFHWLLSHNTVRGHNYEKALEELTSSGRDCIKEASELKQRIFANNLRLQMDGDEEGLGKVKAFTLEFMPADLVQIYKGNGLLSGRIVSIVQQDLLNQLAIQDTKMQLLNRIKVSQLDNDTKEKKLIDNLAALNKSFNTLSLSRFYSEFREAVVKQSQQEKLGIGDFLAENIHIDKLLKMLEDYSERDTTMHNVAESIAKNTKGYLGIEEESTRNMSA
jgi:hypothetical protein